MISFNSRSYEVEWNEVKNSRLKQIRGKSFEDILRMRLVAVIQNPNRSDQSLLLYEANNYVWAVPYAQTENKVFLKTLYPSRKFTKMFRGGEFK